MIIGTSACYLDEALVPILRIAMNNRENFKALMKEHNIKQDQCAVLLEAVTKRPCSVRAIRSWINDPEKKSSRPCPDWAVSALERAIEYMRLAVAKRNES